MSLRIDRITIDGDCTEYENGYERPATEVYSWPVTESGAWINPTQRREWNPRRYEQAVKTVLNQIFSTASGDALRQELLRGSSRILPAPSRDGDTSGAQARYSAMSGPRVLFTPGHHAAEWRDIALFHELIHTVRQITRMFSPRLAHAAARYTNTEEFTAVVVENVYRSETRRSLRYGHADFHSPLRNADAWWNSPRNRNMIARICREMPLFTSLLSAVPAAFNPFRQYFAARSRRV